MTAKNNRVTKADMIDRVADKSGSTKADAKRALDAMLDVVQETLTKGDKITLTGFGTFEVRHTKARKGVNPQTGAKIDIAAKKRPAFKAGAVLKKSVDGK